MDRKLHNHAGFIMLNRNIVDWEWYTDVNTCQVFQHCLLKVNYSDKRWQGITVKKGEFITSNEKLAVETGLTTSKVRTALKKLVASGHVVLEPSNSYTKVRINNLPDFIVDPTIEDDAGYFEKRNSMPNDKPVNNPNTNQSQPNRIPLATTNKNNKDDNQITIEKRKSHFKKQVFEHTPNYSNEILNAFYAYWTEMSQDGKTMRFETERFFEIKKRLIKWSKNENFKKTTQKMLTNR